MQADINKTDTVSVMDFGAFGDGMADDAQAIQRAINSGARHVTIPPGIYNISDPIRPKPNQCLEISGTIRISDAVIQNLQQDVQPGDSKVVVANGSAYVVGQEVTLYDEQLPIHLIDWAINPDGLQPVRGATYQTRRVNAGHARITAICENTLQLDAASIRSYRRDHKACLATQHSAILIEHNNVRICGTGVIDGNKQNQLDAEPCPLDRRNQEESTAGCCIKVVAEQPLSGIIIEDITLQNAILHNLSLGVHNSARFPGCVVIDSIIRRIHSMYAHDKNIVIGRCSNCRVVENVAAYAEFEDGIVLHQVADDRVLAASNILIHSNRCIGNARNGLHVGANMHNIHLSDNICSTNGFNLVLNGDDCTSTGDTVIGYNGRLFPLDKRRPSVLVSGRRITIKNLQVFDSYSVALGISGESITVADSMIANPQTDQKVSEAVGISVSPGSACEKSLYPATGLLPVIMARQENYCADAVRIYHTNIKGFHTSISIDKTARNISMNDPLT
ncbi:MAG: glycosyl hydrolase family 28-related protein [Bacillota bacterium]|nr:glycosyl hydrolase family 28-related protein [Bacillota bacterium]